MFKLPAVMYFFFNGDIILLTCANYRWAMGETSIHSNAFGRWVM